MNFKKNKSLFVFLILLLFVSGAVLYYFKVYKKSFEAKDYYNTPESLFGRIKENPEYLIRENLLQINSLLLFEFFRTRMLFHSFANSSSPEKYFQEELERDFPGERGRVLVEILEVYIHFENEKQKVFQEKKFDEYEKILKIEMLRAEIFGENLVALFFPQKGSETIDKFYAYSERYLKKHYTDMPRSKKNHLFKARREIYANDFERLFSLEPVRRQFELELKINERELSILNEYEKKQAIDEIKERMNSEF